MNDIINEILNNLYFSLTVAEPFADPFAPDNEKEDAFYDLAINPLMKTDTQKALELENAYGAVLTSTQKNSFTVGFKTAFSFLCAILFDDIPPLKTA